jgi:hypothetical protein
LSALLSKMAEIVASSRGLLPHWFVDELPQNPDDIRESSPSGSASMPPRCSSWARKRDAR